MISITKFIAGALFILSVAASVFYFELLPELGDQITCGKFGGLKTIPGCSTSFGFEATLLVAVVVIALAKWWERCSF